ncbi:MAG: bifunctional diaminohydroxyphosphoribosylaminopyrimidine deaminase/5-amino-6-(5-phosphoribosylamino)uracil reductase RibD, partial [Candidatus Omnitrophica bacterium]|nr:bifunctional diaminohydroxyphosphoribosylaminopyrimidine deaminase/5-amino-6-(5-phosphoribosylamino)uracil reductase RibD [Candidatus Omnitrophota bacterium]
MEKDLFFLKKTFQLAKKAEGFTSPNPLAGALFVKNNKIIASGFHKKAGAAHAEIEAIKNSSVSLRGSTLYVNLEPCYHFGKTPPCVDEIIKRGIKRVVVSNIDPNPRVNGKSIKKMRENNIEVKVGLCRKEGKVLNEVFFKNMKKNLPFVTVKVAQSLDGKIATRRGASKWITEKRARLYSRSLRDKYDAVL